MTLRVRGQSSQRYEIALHYSFHVPNVLEMCWIETRALCAVTTKFALPILQMSFTLSHTMEMKADCRKLMTELWEES
jgi:hypothetical protein